MLAREQRKETACLEVESGLFSSMQLHHFFEHCDMHAVQV